MSLRDRRSTEVKASATECFQNDRKFEKKNKKFRFDHLQHLACLPLSLIHTLHSIHITYMYDFVAYFDTICHSIFLHFSHFYVPFYPFLIFHSSLLKLSIFIFIFFFLFVPFRLVWCACVHRFDPPSLYMHTHTQIESISLMWKALKKPSIHATANVQCSIEPKLFQR